jgi:sodium-dependent dicarboxylate transporter 2/3/5
VADKHPSEPPTSRRAQRIGLWLGPALSLGVLLFGDLEPGVPVVTRAAAVAVLMATWWITEAIPLAVTALVPIVAFPTLGVLDGKVVSASYFNHVIFLFIGGFMVALAMQRWNLHERIALRILLLVGVKPRNILLGFMAATAFLSMWISNTATTMMMVPIALAVILEMEKLLEPKEVRRYSIGLFLGVAYAASIGGIATLVGTPPNLSFARIFAITFPQAPEISFARWFAFVLPLSLVFFGLTWAYLGFLHCRHLSATGLDPDLFRKKHADLGSMSFEERIVLADFGLLIFLWLFRTPIDVGFLTIPGWSSLFDHPAYLNDGTVSIAAAMLLFLIPTQTKDGGRILDWRTATGIPWHVVLLFGGGFALARGFLESGLAGWVGGRLTGLSSVHPVLLVLATCLLVTFLTELTSNTATTEMLLPILAGLAVAIEVHPLLLMVPATLSASCAFMLPVATPPNAIVFGTERVGISDMVRAGLLLNLLGALLITTATFLLGRLVLDIGASGLPAWATAP